jgi:geranylgeranyl pyrophosphate synthase
MIGRLISEGSLSCCAGQDLDIQLQNTDAHDEQAYEMTVRKSGSLVAMAFRVGAAVASDDRDVIEAAGTLGGHIGVVAQLLNDLEDVGSDPSRRKGDLRNGKRTLPIAYAVRYAREERREELLGALREPATLTGEQEEAVLAAMHELGAQQFAWTVARAHRNEALAALRNLAEVAERPAVMRLRRLIPRLGS